MSLFGIEKCTSLYEFIKADATFTPKTLLGWGGKILREPHIRVAWGDAELTEGTGEFDDDQNIYVEAWVFDEDGNKRLEAYKELALLIRSVVKRLFLWRDANPEMDISVRFENHADAFAPLYGVQISVEVTSNHICRVIDQL